MSRRMPRKIGLKIKTRTSIALALRSICSKATNHKILMLIFLPEQQIFPFLFFFNGFQKGKEALQWISNILSLSHCCNLVKDREGMSVEMRALTLQNQTRNHSYPPTHTILQKHFIICNSTNTCASKTLSND